ncbi:SPOR domain-containing protein [bacterium]|nr:SPOR domain-containing protein [bacterium]
MVRVMIKNAVIFFLFIPALLFCGIDLGPYLTYWPEPVTALDSLLYQTRFEIYTDIAWKEYKESLSQNPTGPACTELGKIAYSKGLYQQAQILLELDSHKTDENLYWLAQTLLILNEYDSAIVVFNKITKNPYAKFARISIADIYALQGNQNAANEIFRNLGEDKDVCDFVLGQIQIPYNQSGDDTEELKWEGWVIQFGAFISQDNARNLKNLIDKEGFRTRIVQKKVDDTLYYLVWAGIWDSREEAQERAQIMSDLYVYRILYTE